MTSGTRATDENLWQSTHPSDDTQEYEVRYVIATCCERPPTTVQRFKDYFRYKMENLKGVNSQLAKLRMWADASDVNAKKNLGI